MADKIRSYNSDKLDAKTRRDNSVLSEENRLVLQAGTECQPNFIKESWDKVYNNGHDAWIVLTKDRPGSRSSGKGGKGDISCGAIDLVVGRQEMANATGDHWCDPSFKSDAARIYISQKMDIDESFNLCDGKDGKPLSRSGIGIKADAVRVIGREGIKLVTSSDSFNSKGGKIKSRSGIDLIAGNDDSDLQPLVKGDNLVKALESLVEYINGIVETFAAFVKYQMTINADQGKFNNAVFLHTHLVPQSPAGVTLSDTALQLKDPKTGKILSTMPKEIFNMASDSVMSTVNTKTNLVMYKSNVFTPKCFDYILSKNNHTN